MRSYFTVDASCGLGGDSYKIRAVDPGGRSV